MIYLRRQYYMRRDKTIYYMSLYAIFIAVMSILAFVPYVGFISFGPISLTIMHIPVIIFAYLCGWKHGWAFGLVFGVLSLFRSLMGSSSILDGYFINPLVSVLPRVIFGFLLGVFFDLIKKLGNVKTRVVLMVTTSILLTLLHTVMVLGMLGIIYFDAVSVDLSESGGFWLMVGTTVVTSALPECLIAAIVPAPSIHALLPVYNRVFGASVK